MMARWAAITAAALLFLWGCDVAPSELDGLSRANAEAYVVLRDQLNQMPERLGSSSEGVTFCVTVRSPDDPDGLHVNPTLVARLQSNAPAGLTAIIVPDTACPKAGQSGKPALHLYAVFRMTNPDEWMAGYSCGDPCGEGNMYTIYHVLGYPMPFRTMSFIN